jgi:hypothetical protein
MVVKADIVGQFSVKTPTPVHPLLKVRKLWHFWFIFSLQDILERKKYKNGKKNWPDFWPDDLHRVKPHNTVVYKKKRH